MRNKFETLARYGYLARGVVYFLLGAIALSSVFWGMGRTPSSEGAFSTILGRPFGRVLLAAIALGLFGHVLWRLAQAVLNADHHDKDFKGYVVRLGNLAAGLTNTALALLAARLAIGAGSGGGASGEAGFASWLLEQPFGKWLLGIVGLAVVGAGCAQVWRGVKGQYRKRVRLPAEHSTILNFVCGFGLSARGLLIAIIGGFFLYAAFTVQADQAGGLTEALDWVHQLPFGTALYAVAAIGLLAFGAYSCLEARYRNVDASQPAALKQAAKSVAG